MAAIVACRPALYLTEQPASRHTPFTLRLAGSFLASRGGSILASAEGMTREYARGPRGERVQGYVPRNRGTVTTMIGAMGIDGVRAMMTVEGATDAEVFEAFVTICSSRS